MDERERRARACPSPRRLARALLENIYHPVTAVVSFARDESLPVVELMDTFGCEASAREAPDSERVWLMTQHPEGQTALYEEDWLRVRQLCARLGEENVRVFVTGEDIGCVEVTVRADEERGEGPSQAPEGGEQGDDML